jgi:TPR repeat protein
MLQKQIRLLIGQKRYADALPLCRECCDRFHVQVNLYVVLQSLDMSEEVPRLIQEEAAGSASSGFLIGYMHYCGIRPFLHDSSHARAMLERAAERGHVLAMFFCGHTLRAPGSYRWLVASAQLGCKSAMTALAYRFLHGCGTEQNYTQAALWFAKAGNETSLAFLLRTYPQECIPYGIWRPDRVYQMLLPKEMSQQLFTWLLVAKRRRVSPYVALLVCSFVVTRL